MMCPDSYYILENSITNQFMLKNYPVKFYSNNLTKFGFNKNCLQTDDMKFLKTVYKYKREVTKHIQQL
jgi:hypothetical protein